MSATECNLVENKNKIKIEIEINIIMFGSSLSPRFEIFLPTYARFKYIGIHFDCIFPIHSASCFTLLLPCRDLFDFDLDW